MKSLFWSWQLDKTYNRSGKSLRKYDKHIYLKHRSAENILSSSFNTDMIADSTATVPHQWQPSWLFTKIPQWPIRQCFSVQLWDLLRCCHLEMNQLHVLYSDITDKWYRSLQADSSFSTQAKRFPCVLHSALTCTP